METSSTRGTVRSNLPSGFLTEAGGAFLFAATAGTDVGAFSTQAALPTPLLTWTNQASASTVTRTNGLTVTWTGGQPGTTVLITGGSTTQSVSASFGCVAPVSEGTFTVPSYVLATLPAADSDLIVGNQSTPVSFNATGLDFGYAFGYLSYETYVIYQ